jgi:type II secretory pathway pseudopilin PulG
VNAILQGDYDKARDCDAMAKSVAVSQSKRVEEERRQARVRAAEEKLRQARRDYEEVRQESVRKLHEIQRDLKTRMADLDATHHEQMQAFEKKWNSEDFLRRYTKPTPQLIQLKAVEKSMVVARMFDQAKLVRRNAHSAEKQETLERQDMARHEMMLERQQIIDRHTREKSHLKSKCSELLDVGKRQIETEERPFLAHVARFERVVEELKSGAANEPLITPSIAVTSPGRACYELVSARTVKKFAAYKVAPQTPKLKIQPMGTVGGGTKGGRAIRVSPRT